MSLPFTRIPESDLDDLHRRLDATRHPRLPEGTGWSRGTDGPALARLLHRWRTDYQWREHETRLLDLPWTTAGGLNLVHRPSSSANAPTVVLLHGWPDSVLRFERILPLLADANVVVPALPGFPFAPTPTTTGVSVVEIASMVADALQALDYSQYMVSGGDVGGDVAEHLADMHPDRVTALHLTNVSPLHAVFADRSALEEEALAYLDVVARWSRLEGGYIAEQSSKPHTLAVGLADSPSGLAAWLLEKLEAWSERTFDDNDLLTWISAYWLTNTIGSSFGTFIDFARPVPYVATPTLLSTFAHDTKPAPLAYAKHFVNVQRFVEHDRGGHFAAFEEPELYVADLRDAIALGEVRRSSAPAR